MIAQAARITFPVCSLRVMQSKIRIRAGWFLSVFIPIVITSLVGGCASSETQIQKAAKDWCMTIRGCQVIPVYPLTEDIQPGDIYLVQVPVEQQQRLYKQHGFLPLDHHLARLNPDGYADFYAHSFFPKNSTNDLLRDWIRPSGTSHSWQAAPHAAFPSYAFTVNNGAGLSLAVPVQGVPVGLSLLASNAASGTVQIQDAHTVGVDTISLYQQVQDWSAEEANRRFLQHYGTPGGAKSRNYLGIPGIHDSSLDIAAGRGIGAAWQSLARELQTRVPGGIGQSA